MQATCTQCGNKLTIDDAKVPDRPFSVKCPKCQNVLKLPGKGGSAEPAFGAAPSVPPAVPPPSAPSPSSTSAPASDEMRAQMMAQLRREMGPGAAPGSGGRALVALPDKTVAGTVTLTLTRQGLSVDTLDDWEEGARLLEQGVYDVVVTARVAGAAGKSESLYQRINRLSSEARRRIFLILVGDEFKTADGTQAFAVLADLVLHTRDVPAADGIFRSTLAERQRLYQTFLDSRQRHEAAAV